MRATEKYEAVRAGVRTMRIIVLALLAGVVLFTGFVAWRLASDAGAAQEDATAGAATEVALTPILVGIAVVQAVVLLFVRSQMLVRARRRIADGTWTPLGGNAQQKGPFSAAALEDAGDAGRLFQAWMSATIIGCAGLEGAAFLCLVAALIEGQAVALVAGTAFALLLAFQVPTNAGVDRWLEAQLMKLPEDRRHEKR